MEYTIQQTKDIQHGMISQKLYLNIQEQFVKYPVTTEEYIEMMKVTQAKRPKNSQMSKEKLEKAGIEVPQWEDGLKRYLKEEGRI